MKHFINTFLVAAALLAGSCIKNDLPYPVVQLNIEGIEGEGFTVAGIDAAKQTVTLQLDEATDIRHVKFDKVTLTDKATPSQPLAGATFDLRTPLYITLSLYQDYEWTIVAEQTINRHFSVTGQVGTSKFDVKNHTITASVNANVPLTQVTVTSLRLGADDITTYLPTVEDLSGDFTTMKFVDVTSHGVTERWKIYVTTSDASVALEQADAWSRVIWLYGSGIEGEPEMGFRYRVKNGSNDNPWLEAKDVTKVTVDGGSFTACLPVEPQTTYEIKAYCGQEESGAQERTTESVRQLPNAGLEDWTSPSQYSGKSWVPYLLDAQEKPIDAFWGTGNPGAVTLGSDWNLTTGDTTTARPGSAGSTSAKLQTRYVVLKLAAGNLFAGSFAGIRGGTHGVVNFGQPFTLRPTAIRVWVKYKQGIISDKKYINGAPVGTTVNLGDPDKGTVYAALGTWTKEKYGYAKDNELLGTDASPVSIDTRDVKTFFNTQGPDVIAYGEKIFTTSIGEWTEFVIDLDYRGMTDKKPTHLILVCSASRLGDYFTGSPDSALWVDDIELLYDYSYKKQ